MRPNTVHLVEHALGLPVEVTLDAKSWKFVRDDPYRPAGRIALGRGTTVGIGTIGLNFGRRLAFIPGTKRTKPALDLDSLTYKISGTLGAVRGNDHPAADNRIFPEFRQLLNPFNEQSNSTFYDTGKAFLNNSISDSPDRWS